MNMNTIDMKIQQQEIIDVILRSRKNISTDDHQKTIFELLLFESNEIAYSELLLSILSDSQSLIFTHSNVNDQLQILIYIKNFLQRTESRREISLFPQIESTIKKCLEVFFSDSLTNETKKIYDSITKSLLSITQNLKYPKTFFDNLFESLILQFNNNNSENLSPLKIKDYLSFLDKLIRPFMLFTFNQSESLRFIQFFNVIYDRIMCINQRSNDHLQSTELITAFILFFSKVSSSCFDSFHKHIISIYNIDKAQQEQLTKVFFESKLFASLVFKCLSVNTDNILEDYSLSNGQLNMQIVKSKGILIELLSIICEKLHKMNFISQYPQYQEMIADILKGLVIQLGSLYKKEDYPREKVDNSDEEIVQLQTIVKILHFFEEVSGSMYGNELFTQNSKEIFQFIIVPNLLPSPLELSLFAFEPKEYSLQLYQMAKSNVEGLPKRGALKLLISLSKHIDGFFKYIINLYLDILDTITGGLKNQDNKFDKLYLFMMNSIPQEHLLEQALQLFTSLSPIFLEHEALFAQLEERIDHINHILIWISNEYLKTKLCFFYMYFLSSLFNDSQQVLSKSFDDSIIFIFNCILSSNSYCSLILCALNAINYIIFDKKLKKFCGHLVKIYANQIVSHFKSKPELSEIIQSEEYDSFIKGLIKHYLLELEGEAISIFKYFWEDFKTSLANSIRQGKKKVALQDRVSQVVLLKNVTFLKRFTQISLSSNKAIMQEIYTPILALLNQLPNFLNWDFESNILELITSIIEDIKLVPFDYAISLKKYLEALNSGFDGLFDSKLEEYHIDFIFTFIKNMNCSQIEEFKYKEMLQEILADHLLTIQRKVRVGTMYSEHYIYADLGTVYIIVFWNYFTLKDITELIKVFNKRMNTSPNADLTLNLKLSMNIFLLINYADDFEVIRNFNYKPFVIKLVQFYPIDDCCIIEHEQIARFCCSMIRWIIMNMACVIDTSNENEKMITYLINLAYEELKLIKKKTQKEFRKKNRKTFKADSEDEEYDIGRFKVSMRKTKKIDLTEKDSSSFLDEDMLEDEDELANYSDKARNDEEEEEDDDDEKNLKQALNENQFKFDDISKEDKDHNFVCVKKNVNHFESYYRKYCSEVLIIQSSQINVFLLFDLMLSDLESNAAMMYNRIIIQSYNPTQMQLMNDFRKYQKISMDGLFIYRKIIKMKAKEEHINSHSTLRDNPK